MLANEKIVDVTNALRSEKVRMGEKAKVCEFCEEQPAVVLCAECCKCYCGNCCKRIHELMKKDHKTEVIPKGVWVDAMCPLHKKVPLELLCVDDAELCCAMCDRDQLHKNHKVANLSEVDKDNEVFSAAKVRERFEGVLKCDDDLEKKITETIESVQKESESIKEKVSQSFREAHEKLNTEEAAVMEELEKACSEAVEALQKALDSLKGVREYSVVLNEANSKTEGKRSRLMELNIVCEMEKQRKTMNELHEKMIADLRIEWDNEKRKLSFIGHLINGSPIPNDVVFPAVYCTSVDVSWSCEDEELDEDYKKNLVYRVEVKKATESGGGWKEAYRGKDKKCTVSGLEKNTEYNARVKCVIGELQGMWSDVANFKTKNLTIDSAILSKEANFDVFEEKLCEWCGTKNFELLYRGTRDGFGADDFHRLCDNKGKTLVLVKNTSGYVFGGFASIPWTSSNGPKQAPGSFIFTLTNMYGIQPTKFSLKNENDVYAVWHHKDYGPIFGGGFDINISSDRNSSTNSCSGLGYTYSDTTGKGWSIFSSNTSNRNFQVQEIEVFRVC